MADELPTELLLGKVDNEWPVHAFVEDAHALHWIRERHRDGRRKRLWRVTVSVESEVRLIEADARLVSYKEGTE